MGEDLIAAITNTFGVDGGNKKGLEKRQDFFRPAGNPGQPFGTREIGKPDQKQRRLTDVVLPTRKLG